MRMPTFSSVWLAEKCPTSMALPWVNTENERADRGTSRHGFNANRKTMGKKAALKEVKVQHRDEADNLDTSVVDRFFAGMEAVRSEVSYAYNPDTDEARELGENLGRNYTGADQSEEICGTTDDIATDGAVIRLFDLKGRAKKDSIQLGAQAIAASRVLGIDEVEAAYGYTQDDGSIIPETFQYSALDLDLVRERLRVIKSRVRQVHLVVASGGTPDLSEGEHCTWCPARTFCPAKTALVRIAATGELKIPTVDVKALTNVQKASVYKEIVRRYKPIIEALEDAIKEEVVASGEPLDLLDGTMLSIQNGKETIDPAIAVDVLTREYGAETAKKATKPAVTKELLKKVCGGDMDKILRLIREAGGISSGKPFAKEMKAR